MMDLMTIRTLSREQAARARRHGKKPFVLEAQDLEDWKALVAAGKFPRLPFPNIGSYVPAGWKPTGRNFFCDKFGDGDGGRSMSVRELVESLAAGTGYAITEEGEFQLYVSEFLPPKPELFDPKKMLKRAQRLKREGRLVPLDTLLRAVREVKEKLRRRKKWIN